MFNKKPRRNFRQRKESSDEEDKQINNEDGPTDQKGPVVANKPSKVAHGRGISCTSKREVGLSTPDSPSDRDVTAGNEEEGDKGNDDSRKKTVLSFSDDKEALEPEFKLKRSSDKAVLFQVRRKDDPPVRIIQRSEPVSGSVPPSGSPRPDVNSQASPQSSQDDNDVDEEVENDDDDEDDEGGIRSPSSSSSSSFSAHKPVIIPSAEQIAAARRQRSAHRAQREFIPLSKDGQRSRGSTPDHHSRDGDDDEERVDDDEDDEPDDCERRIEFAPRLKSIRERIAEKLGGSESSLSGTDEEQELWEETQIGKGFKRRPGEQSPSGSECSSYSSSSNAQERRAKQKKKGVKIPKTLPSISISMVKRRITGKLDSLKEVHRARQAELSRMQGDVDSAKTSVEALEETSSESQLNFYRSMTLYTHNLVECLREKVVEINALELELHMLLSGHTEALLVKRQQMIKEQADRLQRLSYPTDEQGEISAAATETQGDEGDLRIPEDTRPSPEEEEHLQKQIDDILLRSPAVFSDVQDDFCDVKRILSRFEEWRGNYSDSYHSAYISLCLPKLLNPIIRHQLLGWNPLKDGGGDFENLPWFTAVETFCHGHGHEELEHTDRQTLANVIERTVVVKITAFVELVWDPMSLQQSVCLTEACQRLREDYSIFEGEHSKPVTTFLQAVVDRLRSCVDDDIFIPLYPKKFLEDKASPQSRFRNKQFWTAIKLLGNLGKWDLLLPESVLKELMLDKLLNRYLMITLCSHTLSNDLHACEKIAECLPLHWLRGETGGLPQIQSFRNHLVQKVHTICKQQPAEDPDTRSAVVEVLRVLSRLGCYDSILTVAQKYHYEDVIYSHQLLNQETG